MTIEEIKHFIENLIKFTALATNKKGVTRGMLGKIYEGHAIDARDNLLEAIIEYGRECAAKGFELGKKSVLEQDKESK